MSHLWTPPIRYLAPALAVSATLLGACGTETTSQNDLPTTLSVPSATITPPEDTIPMTGPPTDTTTPTDTTPSDTTPPSETTPPSDTTPPSNTTPSTDTAPPSDTTPASDTTPPSDTAPPSAPGEAAPDGPELTPTQQAAADVAISDVVDRRDVSADDVVVIGVEEVTWSDRSLGCPQRDMQYQQVLTPGIRVILEAAGKRAFYHGTTASDLAYCATPSPPVDG